MRFWHASRSTMHDMTVISSIRLSALLLASALCLPASMALTFEDDPYSARQTYPTLVFTNDGAGTEDPVDDPIGFDSRKQNIVPGVVADMVDYRLEMVDGKTVARYTLAAPMPEDPNMPVNLFTYFDIDGDSANNAPANGPGPEADAGLMLLFGTNTKWHAEVWRYDSVGQKWVRLEEQPAFTVDGAVVTVDVPPILELRPDVTKLRAYTLTADNVGSLVIDVAPGTGLPPLAQAAPAPAADPAPTPDVAPRTTNRNAFLFGILGAMGFLVVVGTATIYIAQKRRHVA